MRLTRFSVVTWSPYVLLLALFAAIAKLMLRVLLRSGPLISDAKTKPGVVRGLAYFAMEFRPT